MDSFLLTLSLLFQEAGANVLLLNFQNSDFDDQGMSVDDILSGGERIENIKINRQIVEVKEVTKDEHGVESCTRHIEERLQTDVNRGDGAGKIQFTHLREGLLEKFPLSVCQ